jgi:hypothetical protein
MPRKSEMRLHNNARSKGVFYGKKIIHTIHTHCAHRFEKLVPVYKRGIPHLFIGFICSCEMQLSYWFYYDYLFQVQNLYTKVLLRSVNKTILRILVTSEHFCHIFVCYNSNRTHTSFPVPLFFRIIPLSLSSQDESKPFTFFLLCILRKLFS